METFTLVFWVVMGWRFEETQLTDLSWRQCSVFAGQMLVERRPVRVTCLPNVPQQAVRPRIYQPGPDDRCFICGPSPDEPPPGHKRI
jgi:hypothetical protein